MRVGFEVTYHGVQCRQIAKQANEKTQVNQE